MAERQILDDAIDVGLVHDRSFAEPAATFRAFTGEQVASAGVGAQHLASCGDFEAFGHGFLCFDAFGTTHKVNFRSKRARNIETGLHQRKRYFGLLSILPIPEPVRALATTGSLFGKSGTHWWRCDPEKCWVRGW